MFRTSTSSSESEAQVGFLFHVMIGINPLGEFRSVKGIGRTVENIEIREGGRNHAPHTRVGPGKYKECTIEWGMSNRTTLYDWIHAVEAGYGYKRLVWVVQLGRDRTPLRIYQLIDAWPVSWEGAELDANNNVVDTEQITIAYEAVLLLTMPSVIVKLPVLPLPELELGRDSEGGGSNLDPVALGGSGELQGDRLWIDPEEQEFGDGVVLGKDFVAVREEPVKIVLTAASKAAEDAKKAAEAAAKAEEKEKEKDEAEEGAEDAEKDEKEDADDEPTDDEPTSNGEPEERATPKPLKMSGGILFERTVFTRPALAAKKDDEKADDEKADDEKADDEKADDDA